MRRVWGGVLTGFGNVRTPKQRIAVTYGRGQGALVRPAKMGFTERVAEPKGSCNSADWTQKRFPLHEMAVISFGHSNEW